MGTAHSAVIELLTISGNEDVGFHDGVNVLVAFGG
jgi:hypothetical protein